MPAETIREVMMSMPEDKALQQAEIHVLRQISENLSALTNRLEKFVDKVDDIQFRVIRLEEQRVSKAVDELKSLLSKATDRINDLESHRDRVLGASDLWNWLLKSGPWLVAAGIAFVAGVLAKKP